MSKVYHLFHVKSFLCNLLSQGESIIANDVLKSMWEVLIISDRFFWVI